MKSNSIKRLAIISAIIVFVGIAFVSLRINSVDISGNKQYDDKQIQKLIFNSKWKKNPLIFYFKTKFGKQEKIPFVSRYDVEIKSLTSVKISVYEKKVVGYIRYFGTNMYFDKDGIVTESSDVILDGIPRITGIKFDYIVLHSKIPVEDEKLFDEIMNITQLLDKYQIKVDRIYISENMEMTLNMDEVKVELGKSGNMNEKIIDLNDMMENLKGLSGTLDMREYDSADEGYTFKKN
ncbi:MAG: cell division protein FtsQ [Lachnospiraceae bacterium]|nr:cell division protein FtsQ [Lachnospiraceae bacterium]MDE6254517.1 cell division protein FtsQ [Lachnospiraceae bacterium]